MNDDLPALPPPGGALVLPSTVYTAMGGAHAHTGVSVARDGRLAICTAGAGLAVRLDAAEMVSLGLLFIQIGHTLEAEAVAAALDAGSAIDRIFAGAAGNA
ncbi:hypothetical protein C8P66_11320 [Humitalea rosea]|uniref:Uncharacterized protein n=1 Tax=Humitalea rosea TaxID=990373 RepID=A0A2W7J1K3_9PROT|nr:hypothetical protein [Humitalea rosea]PZW44853.1 hypothetical protein C8P66_11320 [Humitalea rosea]